MATTAPIGRAQSLHGRPQTVSRPAPAAGNPTLAKPAAAKSAAAKPAAAEQFQGRLARARTAASAKPVPSSKADAPAPRPLGEGQKIFNGDGVWRASQASLFNYARDIGRYADEAAAADPSGPYAADDRKLAETTMGALAQTTKSELNLSGAADQIAAQSRINEAEARLQQSSELSPSAKNGAIAGLELGLRTR